MVAAARVGFDPYAGLTVEAGSIFSSVAKLGRKVLKPVGATFRGAVRNPVGKAALQVAKIGSGVPLLGVVPGASAQVDRALDALSRGNLTGARRAAVAAGVQLAPVVQQALKQFGPAGLAASAAIGALATGVKGGNLEEIAWSAAEGGAPQGIDTAIKAAQEIRRGGSPTRLALSLMSQNLIPGSPAAAGFNLAQSVLSGNAGAATGEIVTKLGAQRRALPTEEGRRGFDLAIGTISRAVKKSPATQKPAGPRVNVLAAPRKPPISALGGAHELAKARLERDPALARQSLATIVRTLRISPTTAQTALGVVRSRFRWRSLSSNAARFVQKHAPTAARVALRDTKGLSDSNTIYVVEAGDGAQRIGDKLLGKGEGVKRWKQLIAANSPPKGVDPKTGNFKILSVGERLKLPASWTAELNARSGTPAPIVAPSPSLAPAGSRFVLVLRGEGPHQIAQRLTGDGNRRKELTAANIPRDADGRARKSDGAGGFSPGLQPGQRLFVPNNWPTHPQAMPLGTVAPVVSPSPLPTVPLPGVTPPPITGPTEDLQAILQAKAILAAWGKTDGLHEAGLPDYGMRAEDVSGIFDSRDRFMLASFASWSNRTQGTRLVASGDFLPEHGDALRAWAEKRSGLPLPTSTPGASVPPVVVLPVPAPPGASLPSSEGSPPPATTEPVKPSPGAPTPPPPGAPSSPSSPKAPAKKDDGGGGAALLAVAIPLAAALLS